MNCGRAEQLLSEQMDRRLAGRETAALEAHLESCRTCRQMREEYRTVAATLRAPVEPFALPELQRRALAYRSEQQAPCRPWRWSSVLNPALAVGLLLILIGLLSGRWSPDRPEPSPHRLGIDRHLKQTLVGLPSRSKSVSPLAAAETIRPTSDESAARSQKATSPERRLGGKHEASPRWPAPGVADLPYVNGSAEDVAQQWVSLPHEEWDRIEARIRRSVQVKDDFVQIPFPRLASVSDRQIAQAAESYKREAAIVDPRLAHEVTCAFKATALSDLCDRLRADTGIQLTAGPSVADEKVTLLCEKLPLREVMRQLSRPFGYAWLRSKKEGGEYHYELVQDLKSQLLEEELRNRDRAEALLALDREMGRYRPYLSLSPDEALTRAKTAPPEEKTLLETLASRGWGPVQMYFRLTPPELAALRSGQTLTFSQEPGELPLPADLARGVLECMREVRLIRRDDSYDFAPGSQHGPSRNPVAGIPLTTVPEARAAVRLSLNRSGESELGRLTLDGSSRFSTGAGSPGGGLSAAPYAVGRSRAVLDPGNEAANARFAHDPALQVKVTVPPVGRGPWAVGSPGLDRPLHTAHHPLPTGAKRLTSADLLEALHAATGMPIVADFHTRLYRPEAVSVKNQPLFAALNRLADAMRLRWNKDRDWLQFRSVSFYDDRLKEVPNRLLARWTAARRDKGELRLDDLIEIAGLSDAQLDAADMGEGARELWGLTEWDLARSRDARRHWRFLARLTPAQRQEAMRPTGLAFTRLSLPQQQQFLAVAVEPQAEPPSFLQELTQAALHVVYTQPGGFEWPGTGSRTLLQFRPSPVRGHTREAVLEGARRLDPQVEPMQIVPTELAVTILFRCGAHPDAYVNVLRITPNGATGYDGRPARS